MRRHRGPTPAAVVAILVVIALNVAPPAACALTPPAVDNGLLPAASAPRPPRATVQVETCFAPAAPGTAVSPSAGLGLDALWSLTRGEGQRVAVIDTGVARHARLGPVEAGGDYVSIGDGTQDCDGHGTVVAGIISAAPDLDDTTGFAGVAPAVTLLSIRQSSTKFGPADEPSSAGFGDVLTMAMAVRTAADLGATVINISSIACASGSLDDGALGAALAYAVDTKDAVVVAAAGNVGGPGSCPRQPHDLELTWETATVAASPGWYDDYVLTVGSVGPDGSPSDFSLPGPWVDVAAPGEHVVSLNPAGPGVVDTMPSFGRQLPISGTSYAAPVVSGVAALIRSRFPELTARQVMQRIEMTARPVGGGWNPVAGNGVVDPAAAMSTEAPSSHPAPPSPTAVAAPSELPPTQDPAVSIALIGTGVCAALLAGVGLIARSRRPHREGIVGRQGR
ncbi:type VII secretion system ESX-4 serine protease mycosin MycP4 [soil metagenome]